MNVNCFVGRINLIKKLEAVLKRENISESKLIIQSIEGPGGIGKTSFINHVFSKLNLCSQNYLTLRIDANSPLPRHLVQLVSKMVDSADAQEIRHKPSGFYFPSVDRVAKEIQLIQSQVISEYTKKYPEDIKGHELIGKLFYKSLELGRRINDAFPATRIFFKAGEIENISLILKNTYPTLESHMVEAPGFWEKIGLSDTKALRNAIKENACRPLVDALINDLSAILKKYQSKKILSAAHHKIKGIDRLLLVIDDYEALHENIGEFLVAHLLPSLRSANFESTVLIIGRDQLEATHPTWDQHLKPNMLNRILLEPLSQIEMDSLVENFGLYSPEEKERAWRDTQGHPYLVQLWIEEAETGGRTALMLQKFYVRTTRWMNDQERVWLQHALFLNEINVRTLNLMLGDKNEALNAFQWFEHEGSVRDTEGSHFRVREYLRSRLLDYLNVSNPDLYDELQRKSNEINNLLKKNI